MKKSHAITLCFNNLTKSYYKIILHKKKLRHVSFSYQKRLKIFRYINNVL